MGRSSRERGYYSKLWLRRIFDANQGASQCVVWEQVLPPGGYIVPHFHYFEEVMSFLGGVAEVQVGTERRTISAGTSVLFPVETVHQVRTVGEEPVRVLAFRATVDPLVQNPSPPRQSHGKLATKCGGPRRQSLKIA